MSMTPKEPYIIRAIYEWILDNDCTPYLMVDANQPHVSVPQEYVQADGRIVLSIRPEAVEAMSMQDDAIEFVGRFGSRAIPVYVPMYAVAGLFARETQDGVFFNVPAVDDNHPVELQPEPEMPPEVEPAPVPVKLKSVKTTEDGNDKPDPDPKGPKGPKGKGPKLSVVK